MMNVQNAQERADVVLQRIKGMEASGASKEFIELVADQARIELYGRLTLSLNFDPTNAKLLECKSLIEKYRVA